LREKGKRWTVEALIPIIGKAGTKGRGGEEGEKKREKRGAIGQPIFGALRKKKKKRVKD